ncbi:DUF418 domain-containing protein [Dehalococcoidales bacterium]|nr:DUF418 domain-containing protein [Dehalococcoidales bacterium]
MTMEPSALAPVSPQQREKVLDVIRGVALFGILFPNLVFFFRLEYFTALIVTLGLTELVQPISPIDMAAYWMVSIFFLLKFFPILAILFGWGCYMIMERAEQKGVSYKSLLWRRLLLLMGFGVLHYVFIWNGDILMILAVSGAFLLLFMRMSTASLRKWIIGWSIGILVIASVVGIGMGIGLQIVAAMEPAKVAYFLNQMDYAVTQVFREGSYWEVVSSRALEVLFMPFVLLFVVPFTLILLLAGLYAAKAKVIDRLIRGEGPLSRALLPSFICAVLGTGISGWMFQGGDHWLVFAVAVIVGIIGWVGQVLFYILALIRLSTSDRFGRFLRPFIPVGQMPLTVYLMQSVIATSIFYGYGLGLADQVGAALGILLTVGIFACCMIFSRLWLKYFDRGPAEWLWRRLMYGRGVRLRSTPTGQ